jgi:nucleotide-binding universal stress UspA family protein
MFETVIIPLDGAAHAEFALPYGREEAFRHAARVVLIHVVPRPELPPTPIAHGGPAPSRPVWPAAELADEERSWLAYLEGVRERFGLPENVRTVVAVGDPVRHILAEARKHPRPLIVVTTGDAAAGVWPPLSEVARRLMVAGGVPVLAVREPAPQTRRLAQIAAAPMAGRLSVVS